MLKTLKLQNFRNYSKRTFELNSAATLIVGPNAIGKTNILEAIYLLATGRSFRAELEKEVVKEDSDVARITGVINNDQSAIINESSIKNEKIKQNSEQELEIIWDRRQRFSKTYKINGVGKRQLDFVGVLKAVLFSPPRY